VPLDSWVYPALDRLTALGYIHSGFADMRPWTRLDVRGRSKKLRIVWPTMKRQGTKRSACTRLCRRNLAVKLSC